MSFNAAATRLAVSSSNRTIHIFDVSANAGERGAAGGSRERGRSRVRTGANSAGQQQQLNIASGGSAGGTGADKGIRQGVEFEQSGGGNGGGNSGDQNSVRQGGLTADGTSSSWGGNHNHSRETSGGGLASGLRSVVGLLPNRVTKSVQDYVDCNRSFASVRLRGSAGRSICALIPAGDVGDWGPRGGAGGRSVRNVYDNRNGDDSARGVGSGVGGDEEEEGEGEILLVVTSEGILYSYAVDTVRGGECRLEQASSLLMDVSGSQEIGSELFESGRRAPPVLAGQG